MLKNNKNSKYLYKFLFAKFCKKCRHSTFIITDSKSGKNTSQFRRRFLQFFTTHFFTFPAPSSMAELALNDQLFLHLVLRLHR